MITDGVFTCEVKDIVKHGPSEWDDREPVVWIVLGRVVTIGERNDENGLDVDYVLLIESIYAQHDMEVRLDEDTVDYAEIAASAWQQFDADIADGQYPVR